MTWRTLKEIAGNKRYEILGGRTLAENHEWWLDRCRRDANIGGKNHVPPPPREEYPPEPGNDAELLRMHLERAVVPDRIANVIHGGLEERDAVQALRRWWGFGKSFALLFGESGGGKSVAAASAFLNMRRVIRWDGGRHEEWDSAECAFQSADELARLSYFDSTKLLDHLGRITCLVLDDLGVELMTDSWRATLDALLAERFGRTRCRTVLTTNVSARKPGPDKPSPFEVRYGARIARRIRESGVVIAVEGAT